MKMIKIFAVTISFILLLSSCRREDPLGNVNDIPGLGGDTWTQGPIDKWIYDSLTVPFNIDVAYKWNAFALNQLDKNVVPVKEEIVIPVLSAMKRVWINSYVAEIGGLFKSYTPKFFVLAGSGAYQFDGGVLLGQAGGGRQIFMFELNYFRNKTMPGYDITTDTFIQKTTFQTVEHEFAHIFDQTKKRPLDFDKISQGTYSSDWINVGNVEARKDGFITADA